MNEYFGKSATHVLSALLLCFLFVPSAVMADYNFFSCYKGGAEISSPRVAWNMWAIAPHDFASRMQKCAQFCENGQSEGDSRYVNVAAGGFPHKYATYEPGNWCICGSDIKGTQVAATGTDANRCPHLISAYQRGSVSSGGVVQPPAATNRPPRAPTVQPGGWEPAFPLRYEGAIQLTWQNNGDPDGDPVYFWLDVWWWNAQQSQWVHFIGQWVNDGNYTMTSDSGQLVPDMYYIWRVAAVTAQVSNPWHAYSDFARFRTAP